MFKKKPVVCPAGEWTTILQSSFAQMPAVWNLYLRSDDGEVAGEFEEKKSRWLFPGTPVSGELRESLRFERGYWNTFYSVRIRPRTSLIVEIR